MLLSLNMLGTFKLRYDGCQRDYLPANFLSNRSLQNLTCKMFLAQRSLRDCLLRVMEDDFDWPHGIKDTIREVTMIIQHWSGHLTQVFGRISGCRSKTGAPNQGRLTSQVVYYSVHSPGGQWCPGSHQSF